ncbi:MAG: hypothetical protein ABJC26_19090 [Gemmatimonadaceae bacterium]
MTLLLAAIAPLASADAQAASGVGDDAVPIPVHGTRIRIGGFWSNYDSRFATTEDGSYKRGPLFGGFNRDNLGVADIPAFNYTQDNIRKLSGLGAAFNLSLGRLEASGNVVKSVVPFQIDVGIRKRLSIGLVVPYVQTTADNKIVLNRGGIGATVGENPAKATGSAARITNGLLLSQIDAAGAALTAEIARCADVAQTGGSCEAIRANPTGAQSLLTQSSTIKLLVTALYGTADHSGALLVPITKSAAQAAVENTIGNLRSNFLQYSVSAIDGTRLPQGDTTVYGSAGLQSLVKENALGLGYDTLTNGGHSGVGDIDLTATLLLFDSFGASQTKRLEASKRAYRSTLTAGWRFGTATGARTARPFDVPTGDGANALLLRSTTDVIFGRRWWVSATGRVVKPLQDNVVARFPALDDNNLFEAAAVLPGVRALGTRTEIEIAPRYAINSFFGLSMAYGIGHQGSSTITAAPNFVDGSTSGSTAQTPGILTNYYLATTVQSLQFGVTYSTLTGFVKHHSRWPIEIIYSHGLTLTASGGPVPSTTSDQIQLRVYTRFPR